MDSYWHPIDEPVACAVFAIVLLALSGIPSLLIRPPGWGQKIAAAITVIASTLGLIASGRMLNEPLPSRYILDWQLPFGPCELSSDPLSTLFLLPLFLATGCCSLYATAYWAARDHPSSEKKMTFFFGLLAASMALVVLARNGVLFLMAWEVMALSAYFLITTDQLDPKVQRAGTVYLLATHTGTTALFVLFALLCKNTGSFAFPEAHTLSPLVTPAAAILVAALIGFGAKAGIMPLHIWLPGAHANAPSHVSAMMSGIMLKIGIYGILRTVSFFAATPDWFGWLILLLGAISAVTGIALAAVQRDLKRLLACSSIENIGIVFIGLGMGLIGLQTGNTALVVFGFAGGFMHIINHGIFKPLLFLGSGVLIHATGTREIDQMGGLAKRLPQSTPIFLIGVFAICGLPPLNGFVGELFIYFGAFSDALSSPTPLISLLAPLFAFIGGLTLITFVKFFGIIFLGSPRTSAAAHAHEASGAMVAPMALLALCCLTAGVVAPLLLQAVKPVVIYYSGISSAAFTHVAHTVPLATISLVNGALILLVLLAGLIYCRMIAHRPQTLTMTWGCGFPASTPRIQYTGTSFTEQAANLLGVIVTPDRHYPRINGNLPETARFRYTVTETILDRILTPIFLIAGQAFAYMRRLQHGQMHLYMLYIFATLFALMLLPH